MPINIDDTRTLLQAIERTNPPTTTLIDTFFPAVKTFLTNTVDMEYRRRHIAEALVAEMQKEAAKRGTRSIFLEVRCSNTGAIALYQKMGFSICGTRRGFYEKPKEDAYVMVYTPEISTTTGEN